MSGVRSSAARERRHEGAAPRREPVRDLGPAPPASTRTLDERAIAARRRIEAGGALRYHQKNRERGKLFVRERLDRLFDEGTFVEDAAFASFEAGNLPADGTITGIGLVDGRRVAVVANDSTVKAGSWGRRAVEKILRIQETAGKIGIPLVYLVDSAGARITDQVEMFPGRRGAGRIFHNQVRLSGKVPQVCLLFGPSAAGGAYVPAFCDVVVMVDGNASMYLGSPRMAEMVIGEKTTLEEMGGAKMHCSVSGCGDVLVGSEEEALAFARRYLSYFPSSCGAPPPPVEASEPSFTGSLCDVIPSDERKPFDMRLVVDALVDAGSWCGIKELWAREILTGLARIGGRTVGIVANQPSAKGGVLFVDSADKAAKFVSLCDAFDIPLVFLADVPGFMIGSKVEREGIIRAGAKMIAAVSEATVPKISVVVRKAYGAGLYAMCGPAFEADACLALPSASIAVMGPEAAVNAVFANKIAERPEAERPAYVEKLRAEYREDIDIYRLASELVVDAIVPAAELREELVRRLALLEGKARPVPEKHHAVHPV